MELERRFEAELQGLRAQQQQELGALEERLKAQHMAESEGLKAQQQAELEEIRLKQQEQVCMCFDKDSTYYRPVLSSTPALMLCVIYDVCPD